MPEQKMSPYFASLSALISAYRRDNRWRSGRSYSRRQLAGLVVLANAIANQDNQ